MESLDRLQEFLDKVLYHALKPEYEALVNQGGALFKAPGTEDTLYGSEFGFNQWLIHDYRFEGQDHGFIAQYLESAADASEQALGQQALASRLSVFQVLRTQHNLVLKDLLTRRDYALANDALAEALDDTALHLLRIYPAGERWLAVPESEGIPPSFREPISRGILEKYQEAVRLHGPQDIEAFIYSNPILIYKLVEIIASLEVQEEDAEEAYTVHQSRYVMKSLKDTAAQLEAMAGVELAIAEEGVWIFRLSAPEEPETQLAEIVLSEQTLDVECLSRQDLMTSRRLLEAYLGDSIAHLRDEVLDIDALLEG